MPSVMDTPARVDHDNHNFQEAQPQVRTTPCGFWCTVMQYVRRYRASRASRTRSVSRVSLHPTESPMARLAQEHPMLYLLGFCGIHSG
jgi:hypothetical protein